MNFGLLALLGLAGYAAYKSGVFSGIGATATGNGTSTVTSSTGSAVTLPGLIVPAGVTMSATDIAVARALLNTSANIILSNGAIQSDPGPSGLYLDARGVSAADRLAAINYGLSIMATSGGTLFDAIANG